MMLKHWMSILTLALINPSLGAFEMPSPEAKTMPDYSDVTSIEIAKALAKEGRLVKILLFPAEFGGEEISTNVVYVSPEAAEMKDMLTGTLVRYVEEGLIDNLDVSVEYKGKSFVPSHILMKASHSSKDGKFNPTIEVW